MSPQRIQLKRTKGWRMPTNTMKVDRTSKWGNPFKVGCNPSEFSTALPMRCESVEVAVECYRYFAESYVLITSGRWVEPLRGKNLGCWCNIGAPCHADVLLELANK